MQECSSLLELSLRQERARDELQLSFRSGGRMRYVTDDAIEGGSACQESMSKMEVGGYEEVAGVTKSCIVEVDRIDTCAEEVYVQCRLRLATRLSRRVICREQDHESGKSKYCKTGMVVCKTILQVLILAARSRLFS